MIIIYNMYSLILHLSCINYSYLFCHIYDLHWAEVYTRNNAFIIYLLLPRRDGKWQMRWNIIYKDRSAKVEKHHKGVKGWNIRKAIKIKLLNITEIAEVTVSIIYVLPCKPSMGILSLWRCYELGCWFGTKPTYVSN